MAVYVKYGDIPGDATHDTHKGSDGWWAAGTSQFGVSRYVQATAGNTANRNSAQASVSDITLSKESNTSTPVFFKEACSGQGKTCTIDYVMDGGQASEIFLQLTLTNAMISNWSSSSGGDRPSEMLSISYEKLEVKSFTYDAAGAATDQKAHTFDVGVGKITA